MPLGGCWLNAEFLRLNQRWCQLLDFLKNHRLRSNFSIGNLSKHRPVCYFFPLPSVILFRRFICPCLSPWAVQFVLSSIQGLPHMTLCAPSSSSSLSFFPQGDRGGRLTLQKRWTSFLKARLTCSLPEYDFHFNMLRSVFVLPGHMPQDTLFYGIFGLEWWGSVVKLWLTGTLRMQMQMSEAKMKGGNRYMETAEADKKGWDESEGQDKVMRAFLFKQYEKGKLVGRLLLQFGERILIKN